MFETVQSARSRQTIYILIAFCVLGFFMQSGTLSDGAYALSREGVLEKHRYYQLISYAFMHGDVWHLLFNMWGLYLFGTMIAQAMTPARVIWLFLISAVTGGALFILTNPDSYCVGASGAVCGFTAAAAMINPKARIALIIAPVPISMSTFFWVFLVLEAVFSFGQSDNIAHLAHIGGVFGGYAYLRILKLGEWDPFGALFGASKLKPDFNPYRDPAPFTGNKADEPISSREVDRLLDKISREGVNSLSREEYELLQRARDRFKRH